MYIIKAEAAFDSAHFLSGYNGKCSQLHGHRWRISAEIYDNKLISDGQCRGMVCDFGDIKRDLREIADYYDHTFIFEKGTLKKSTVEALNDEHFKLTEVDFRPTAENFAKCIYDILCKKGYKLKCVTVYETPDNCASYCGNE